MIADDGGAALVDRHRYAPTGPVWRAGAFHGGRSRSPLRMIGVNLRILRFGVGGSRCWGGHGRHSWSTVVHLEVLTQRATHASPLHR